MAREHIIIPGMETTAITGGQKGSTPHAIYLQETLGNFLHISYEA